MYHILMEIKAVRYIRDIVLNTWFGDLFDDNGDLIIHKQNC